MLCPHCRQNFHEEVATFFLGVDNEAGWVIDRFGCPACKRYCFFLVSGTAVMEQDGRMFGGFISNRPQTRQMVRPIGSSRPACPVEVPDDIADDYTEACIVFPHSTKASAALSRRCLQHLLRDKGFQARDLNAEIDAVLKSNQLPSHLAGDLDAIRVTGNFAAHPSKSTATGEIVEVEEHEAEWNLDILERLFDFFYVQPALAKKKRDELNKKLVAAGKPPLK